LIQLVTFIGQAELAEKRRITDQIKQVGSPGIKSGRPLG
jgi:hypothetical protein